MLIDKPQSNLRISVKNRILTAAIVGLGLLNAPLWSQAPQGAQKQVNTTEIGDQNRAASAMATSGDFMVVWESEYASDDSYGAILGQFFQGGTAVGSELLINDVTEGLQTGPSIAVDSAGRYLVVWRSDTSSGNDNSDTSIQGKLYDSNGQAVGGQFQVNSYSTSSQLQPAVAALSSGFVVAWSSYGSNGGDQFLSSIQSRTVNSNGVPQGADYQTNMADIFHQRNPAVEGSGAGFMVVWESGFSYGNDGSGDSLQLRTFSGAGQPTSTEIQANSLTGSHQRRPAVRRHGDGSFLVVWDSLDSAGDDDFGQSIQLRRFSASGTAFGTEFQVNSHTDAGQRQPSLASTHDGGFVVGWHSDDSSDDTNYGRVVQLQRFSSALNPVGSGVEINQNPAGAESRPQVVGSGNGTLAVTWEDDFSAGGGGDEDGQSVQYRMASTAPVCNPSATVLCLQDGRFRVEASWENQNGQDGEGQAILLTEDTGYFWFFNSANVEIVVKVLNACGPFDRFWVFAGGLTDQGVELRVTDTLAGVTKTYVNPLGTPFAPIQDTGSFQTCDLGGFQSGQSFRELESGGDLIGSNSLFLNEDRFEVSVDWVTTQDQGEGRPVELTSDTGYFWFFREANVEMVVKVLNACSLNDNYWVFAGGLTNVEVTMTVRDTQTGEDKVYVNPQGTQFQPIIDTRALAVCP